MAAQARTVFTRWWWGPSPTVFRTIPAGYKSFEHTFRPEVDPGPDAPYVWAHEFQLVGGEGGYLGLTSRHEATGSGKAAVLAIWGAVGAEGHGASQLSGERPGLICRVPYPWAQGGTYRMRVWTDDREWWSAAVSDEATGVETMIGRIQVPADWRRLASYSVMWTDFSGGLARCQDLPPSRVVFSEPTADGGTVQVQRRESSLGEGSCESSNAEDVPGGVRHEMGMT